MKSTKRVQKFFTMNSLKDIPAVIMAGGKGTRIQEITKGELPKPMIQICGKPILLRAIENISAFGVKNFIIVISLHGECIRDYFGNGHRFGVNIDYLVEKEPLGTAGSLFFLKKIIKTDFILVFGDLIFNIDWHKMFQFHCENKAFMTLFGHPNSHPFDSDVLEVDNHKKLIGFYPKGVKRDFYYHNLVNAGLYIVSNSMFNEFKHLSKRDIEKDIIFKKYLEENIYVYKSSEYVKDCGTPERYEDVCSDIKNDIVDSKILTKKQKCVFLDRDGTINKYDGFITDPRQISLEKGVVEGLKEIRRRGYLIIVITNQPVIARGECSFAELDNIHKKIETLLGKEGAFYDDLYFCPHHPDKGYEGEIKKLKVNCLCRKPKTGLLLRAREDYNIDFNNSYFVGDTTVDIKTGMNANIKTILLKTGLAGLDGKYAVTPDFQIDNLSEITKIIN